jgi:hypothetical protein
VFPDIPARAILGNRRDRLTSSFTLQVALTQTLADN